MANEPIKEEVKLKKVENRQDHLDNLEKTIVIKTEMDAYINEIVKGQPQTADQITVKDVSTEEGQHRLSLPKRIKEKYDKKYSFRWVNKSKAWIDRAIHVRGWLIVNRVLFSDMPKHYFTAKGTVENGDAILCFMPMEQAERLRQEPQIKSRDLVRNLPMEQWKKTGGEDSPFYKPTLGQEEKDGEVLSIGLQPDVQPQT